MYDLLSMYLDNGLRVVMHRIPKSKVTACGVWVKFGSKDEPKALNGIAHLIEHLKFNGTNPHNEALGQKINAMISLGVQYNAGTTKETTSFYMTGLNDTIDLCLDCLSNIVIDHTSFENDFFENEKKVVFKEIDSYLSSFNQIKERMTQALWGNVGIGQLILGNKQNLENITLEQIDDVLAQAYTPENATLVIVGGLEYGEMLEKIEERFGRWADRKTRIPSEVIDQEPGIFFLESKGIHNSVIDIGFRTPGIHSKSKYRVEVVSKIMGESGLESRLMQALRVRRGLSYNLGSHTSFYGDYGTIGFSAVCSNTQIYATTEAIMEETVKLAQDGISEIEVDRAKKQLLTKTLLDLENITAQLKFIGRQISYGKLFSMEEEIRRIRSIECSEVNETIEEIFIEENMGLASIGDYQLDTILELVSLRGEG